MKKLLGLCAIILAIGLAGCKATLKDPAAQAQLEKAVNPGEIPYVVAHNYFVNNDVDSVPHQPLTTAGEFDVFFGKAPVMGKDGAPTKIDFKKEYVIAVAEPTTEFATTIEPVSLVRNEAGQIVFTYKVTKGEQRSFSITPCLILVVSNDYPGQVIYNQI